MMVSRRVVSIASSPELSLQSHYANDALVLSLHGVADPLGSMNRPAICTACSIARRRKGYDLTGGSASVKHPAFHMMETWRAARSRDQTGNGHKQPYSVTDGRNRFDQS
jgi:hypothetical protein